MKEKLIRFLSSARTTIALLLIYAAGLGGATFLEKYAGTEAARTYIYYSPAFICLQGLLIVNCIALLVRRRYFRSRKWGLILSHFSLIVILAGALLSHLTAEEGFVHIREGERTDALLIRDGTGTSVRTLPFSLELIRFNLHRYPGSSSPSSYESELIVRVDGKSYPDRIYMNRVLDIKGYRFYQASFDPDERGTVLSVNRDGPGRTVTYAGYAGLLAGLILCLTGRDSRFRQLSRILRELRRSTGPAGCMLVGILFFSLPVRAETRNRDFSLPEAVRRSAVPQEHAARFGALPMQSADGRMEPVNTFSSEIVRKIYKKNRIDGLSSDQFLLSVLAMPEIWTQVPVIAVPGRELTEYLHLGGETCSFAELFDDSGRYRLEGLVRLAYGKMAAERTAFDKDLLKLDEQANIFNQLLERRLLNLLPLEGDPNDKWYAPGDDLSGFAGKDSMFVTRIFDWYLSEVRTAMQSGDWKKAGDVLEMISVYQHAKNKTLDIGPERMQREIRYNRLQIFRKCRIGYFALGGLLLLAGFASFTVRRRWLRSATAILAGGVVAFFLFHTFGLGLRWYIGGYAPWSNSYETMVYVAWATAAAGLLFARRSLVTCALAVLFAGVILFVSGLNWMDPQIGTLVPVLKSPWLMFHVAVIVAAYGFFGIGFLLGLTDLALMCGGTGSGARWMRIRELSLINEMVLIIGLVLMTIGTFLGAVWANESWGRYWGWDPKETWALVTILVYAVATHMRLIRGGDNPWLFNSLSVLAFASVLMTFFGVNYFLSGMHAYGENANMGGLFGYLYAAAAVVLILCIVSYRGYKQHKASIHN